MKEFLDGLYSSYLYRDIVSYFLPGVVASFAVLAMLLGGRLPRTLFDQKNTSTLIVAALGAYALGLLLQAAGTFDYPDETGWAPLRFYPTRADMTENASLVVEDCRFNQRDLLSRPDASIVDYSGKRLERFIALAQTHGNMAAACFLGFVTALVSALTRVPRVERRLRGTTDQPKGWVSPRWGAWLVVAGLALASALVFYGEHKRLRVKQVVFTHLQQVLLPPPVPPTIQTQTTGSNASAVSAVVTNPSPAPEPGSLQVSGRIEVVSESPPPAATQPVDRVALKALDCANEHFATPYDP